MHIGILGTGKMGATLANLLTGAGRNISLGSRTPEAKRHQFDQPGFNVTDLQSAVDQADVVISALPWANTIDTLRSLDNLSEKILVDITNPLAPDLSELVVGGNTSAAEEISKSIPGARIVKAFNTINAQNLADPRFCGTQAQLFYCGNDDEANSLIEKLIDDTGFRPVYCGDLTCARHMEGLAMLWIQLAFYQDYGTDFTLQVVRGK